MVVEPKIKQIYTEIQRELYYLIPEKWSEVYLYASIIDHYGNLTTGELYFYYIPRGVLKKHPVNVYEIPTKFSIGEEQYLKLVDKLYEKIKMLRKVCIALGEKKWYSVVISMVDLKFKVEYNYEDLARSHFNSYENHIVFRYMYLGYPLSSFSKEEQQVIIRYMQENKNKKQNVKIYEETIYEMPFETIEIGSKRSNIQYVKDDDERLIEERKDFKTQILKSGN